jgi:DASS family divalent anion:Na+ symporter
VAQNSPEAPALAATRLREMGPLTWDEIILISVMSIAVALWIVGAYIGVSPAAAALLGLSLLLLTGVLQWKDCLGYTPAWDTLTWFSILVGMSEQLKQLGVIDFFAQAVTALLEAHNIGTWGAFALLHAVYFLMHYMIASQTAHVGALYSAFLSLMLKTGVPGKLAAFTLAFSTNLFGGISTYSSAQSAGYYGTGYIPMKVPTYARLSSPAYNCMRRWT